VVVLLAGCPAIYDAQYNDRKTALEKNRTLFLDDQTRVQFYTAGDDRLFWIDTPQTLEATELHSIDTRNGGQQLDYPWSKSIGVNTDGGPNIAFGDDLVVECEEATAFDATSSSEQTSPFPSISTGSLPCTVAGGSAYFVFSEDGSNSFIWRWTPSQGSNLQQVEPLGTIGTSVNAIGFTDTSDSEFLYWEGNNLWLLPADGSSPPDAPLNMQNQPAASGTVAFDNQGVVFVTSLGETSDEPFYLSYAQPGVVTAVSDMIKNGGYSLNFEHGDVQDLASQGTYTIYQRNLVYEASGGIFALNLDTGEVTDILLDGLPNSDDDIAPDYRNPQVTSTGKLFVQDTSFLASQHPVYEVDLNAILR
jgi:hypothetical protein